MDFEYIFSLISVWISKGDSDKIASFLETILLSTLNSFDKVVILPLKLLLRLL